jgi:hypothetical protein
VPTLNSLARSVRLGRSTVEPPGMTTSASVPEGTNNVAVRTPRMSSAGSALCSSAAVVGNSISELMESGAMSTTSSTKL